MTLVRAWRRQLGVASGAALMVPSAMVAALVALVLSGAFSQLGVLGQIFAGPPAPSGGSLSATGGARASGSAHGATGPIPILPVALARHVATEHAPIARGDVGSSGVAITPGATGTLPVTGGRSGVPSSGPGSPAGGSSFGTSGAGSSSGLTAGPAPSLHPSASPSLQPTPVDQVVKVITSVTSEVPSPAGSTATPAVQNAGTAVNGLLPGSSPSPAPSQSPAPSSPGAGPRLSLP